jgi:hypothetical protein
MTDTNKPQSTSRIISPIQRLQSIGVDGGDTPAAPNFADYVRRDQPEYEPTEDQLQFRNHVLKGGYEQDLIPVPEIDAPASVPGDFFPSEDVPEI